ncbi:hypothetical protein ACE1OC_34060 [Streptomyces sp. DSM 116496]|uniref:hypothetical protein n=1 Tax=Streptomyces stoeckheimensis TaxID=3344656 RepID=UPI0038B306D1
MTGDAHSTAERRIRSGPTSWADAPAEDGAWGAPSGAAGRVVRTLRRAACAR